MIKNLWLKSFLLLVSVSFIALSAAFFLRGLMVNDFREYLEGEMEDRVAWVTASLESSHERKSGWDPSQVQENLIWALMLGFDARLHDSDGTPVMDTGKAIDALSPLVRKRVMEISETLSGEKTEGYIPYALFLAGREIGRLEVRFLRPRKEMVFVQRSNRFLLLSLLLMGGVAVTLSILFSKKMTDPILMLTHAVSAVGAGDLKKRVITRGGDEIERLSEAFNTMADSLEIQESLRKKLTSNIAHELRTPISAMRGELEGMMDGYIPADREHLQSLHDETGRLRRILEGIEELSQAEASRLTLRKQSFDLSPFLRNIAGRFKKEFMERGILDEVICEEGLNAHADPDRLSQIMLNLLSNALRATPNGGHIRVRAVRKGSDVEIEVADTGVGIREEDLPFIFERFYRGAGGGLGLGLTIVRELAEAHGGTISVKSTPGKGTIFTLALPGPVTS